MSPKPVGPPRKFLDYIQWKVRRMHTRPGVTLPCMGCRGYGVVYDPNDPPDVYEGNKCRRKISCNSCKGTGYATLQDYRKIYRQDWANYSQRLREYNKTKKLIASIKRKLTKEEQLYLRGTLLK